MPRSMDATAAQEFSESFGMIGAGWWRQIAWAKQQGIPDALGMSTRDWVEHYVGGWARLAIEDRREAVLELVGQPEPDNESARGMTRLGVRDEAWERGPPMTESNAERSLATLIEWERLPRPEREVTFHPSRKWRFDFAWPDSMVAVEVEGGSWVNGAHTRGGHFESDAEKYNEAALLGWLVLRVTPRQIEAGQALWWVRKALNLPRKAAA